MENVTNCAGTAIARYWYDYTGRKIKAIEGGVTTYYPFPGFESVVNGTRLDNTTYYYANGEIVARKDSNGAMHYYHGDQLGSTSLITDANGAVEETTKYYPFGQLRSGGAKTKYLFNGKELASATGLYDYGARQYNPATMHFIMPDRTIQDPYNPQTLNLYSYVNNNPLKYTDPTGESPLLMLAVKDQASIRQGICSIYNWLSGPNTPENRFTNRVLGTAFLTTPLGSVGEIGEAAEEANSIKGAEMAAKAAEEGKVGSIGSTTAADAGKTPEQSIMGILKNDRTSPAGLEYPSASTDLFGKDRIEHVMEHYGSNSNKQTQSITNTQSNAFELNDQAYTTGVKSQQRNGNWRYTFKSENPVGTKGERNWILVTRKDQCNSVVTSRPM